MITEKQLKDKVAAAKLKRQEEDKKDQLIQSAIHLNVCPTCGENLQLYYSFFFGLGKNCESCGFEYRYPKDR